MFCLYLLSLKKNLGQSFSVKRWSLLSLHLVHTLVKLRATLFQSFIQSKYLNLLCLVINEGALVATAVTLQINLSTGCPARDWRSLKTFAPYQNKLFSKIPLLICNWVRFFDEKAFLHSASKSFSWSFWKTF